MAFKCLYITHENVCLMSPSIIIDWMPSEYEARMQTANFSYVLFENNQRNAVCVCPCVREHFGSRHVHLKTSVHSTCIAAS